VRLTVLSNVSDFLARHFTGAAPFNLAYKSLTFTPDNSPNFYRVCIRQVTALPTDPQGGTPVTLALDDSKRVDVLGAQTVPLFGQRYASFYIGSHGYITFTGPDVNWIASTSAHFDRPRISGFFDDINPVQRSVSYQQLSDRIAVTYLGLPHTTLGGSNTVQIEMFFDGRIRLTWLATSATSPLVGLSRGGGTPSGFVESNFIAAPLELSAVFEQWVASHGLQPIERGGTDIDSDGDGLSNWAEFAFGTSPVVGGSSPVQIQAESNVAVFRFVARDSGFNYRVERSDDILSPFEPAPNVTVSRSPTRRSAPTGYSNMEFAVPLSGSSFYRVKATAE
jgi:hypothetical protein